MNVFFRAGATAFAFMLSTNLATEARAQQSQIEIFYEEPSNLELRPIFEHLKRGGLLERLRELLTPVRLPRTLTVRTARSVTRLPAPTNPEGQ